MATAQSLEGRGLRNAYDSIAASADDSVLVAAVTGRKIRVCSVVINQGDTTPSSVTFLSDSTAIYPPLKAAANGGFVMGDNPRGWFETDVGEALKVDTGAGSTTSVAVTYELVG